MPKITQTCLMDSSLKLERLPGPINFRKYETSDYSVSMWSWSTDPKPCWSIWLSTIFYIPFTTEVPRELIRGMFPIKIVCPCIDHNLITQTKPSGLTFENYYSWFNCMHHNMLLNFIRVHNYMGHCEKVNPHHKAID